MLCQRYYYKIKATSTAYAYFGIGYNESSTTAVIQTFFPVPMRTEPTALEQSGTAAQYQIVPFGGTCSAVPSLFTNATVWQATTLATVASGLTQGYASGFRALNNTNAFLAWSAEL
jgi:hypothetical protein